MNPTGKIKIPNGTILDLKDNNAAYSVEIVNNTLNLKNADGTIISSVPLPTGNANYRLDEENLRSLNFGSYSAGKTDVVDNNSNKLVSTQPNSYILYDPNTNKVVARFVHKSTCDRVPTLVKTYNTSATTINPNVPFSFIPIVDNIANEITNYISNLRTKYGNSLLQTEGCIFDSTVSLGMIPPAFKGTWNAYDSSDRIIGTGFRYDDQPLSYGIPMRSLLSGATISYIKALLNYLPTDVGGLLKTIYYDDNVYTGDVVFLRDASANEQNDEITVSGVYNAKLVQISRVNNDGSVSSIIYSGNVTNNSFVMPLTNCDSNETTVVKIHLYANNSYAPSNGDIEFYITLPTGKTIATLE